MCGAENLSKIAPFMEIFVTARTVASVVYGVIERKSKIDPSSNGRSFPIRADIRFGGVHFSYPSRPGAQVKQKCCRIFRMGKKKEN